MTSIRWKTAQYFEKKWWKKYLNNKNPLEYHKWKQDYWLGFLKEISEWVMPSDDYRMLDMGCGPSGIFIVLPGKISAVDPLFEDYKKQLPYFKPESYKNVKFINSTAENFKCNETYDIVFSLNVINHVADIKKAIKTLSNCCSRGGKLVISVDAHNYGFLQTCLKFLQFDILHPYQLNLNEYKKLIENEGFNIKGEKRLKRSFIFDYYVIVAEKF